MNEIKTQKVNIRYVKERGKKAFHPKFISWSYRYLGNAARIHINNITKKQILRPNQNDPGIKLRIWKGGNHPPKNNIVLKEHINSIFAYSPKENNANPIAEYSTL